MARNEAILVTWLQDYLDFSKDRATWTYEHDRVNIFLQSWKTDRTKLPPDIRQMLNIADKYGVRLDGLAFSRDIIRQMPMWLHIEAEVKCLKKNHAVRTVGDAETLARKSQTARHTKRSNCKCTACTDTRRTTPCNNPGRCFAKARQLIHCLPPKWNPMVRQNEDVEPEDLPIPENEESRTFDWRITTKGNLSDAFRIFTMGEKSNNLWINEWDPDRPQNYIDVYTDGSCEKNGDDDASAGAGIFSIRIPKSLKQTNQTGEIIAIKEAHELTICSDSRTALDGLTTLRQKWEDTGYIDVENADEFRVTTARLRTRKAISTMKKVKAHVGIEGNEEADRLANEGRVKPNEDAIDMVIPGHLRLTGAKLRCMNQSMLYKAIKIQKMKRPQQQKKLNRRATSENIERAKLGAMTISGKTPTAKRIWCSLRHKDFSRQFRYFLWMTIHNGYMIGRFWDRTEEPWKGTCAFCGVEETMEHILTECRGPGMEEIWSL
ncbi:hypothetical protein EV361DRAFT_933969, partial [Lentinula raphanica]